jgi:hypothetical protein
LYLDELCNFPKAEFNDQVDSTTQFLNWIHEPSFGLMAVYKAENQKVRLDKIRRGEPIRYLIPGMPGSAVYICAREGCGKELIHNGPSIVQSRGLRFCSQEHAW